VGRGLTPLGCGRADRARHRRGAVIAAADLFDDPPQQDAARRFVDEPGHHLLIAYVDDEPVGLVSGVETTHPDKGTEMFLYELGVEEPYRRRGIATALVDALKRLAQDRGCYGMWVGVDRGNEAALATYRGAGGGDPEPCVTFTWEFQTDSATVGGRVPGPLSDRP
jgi:ribosomal protein S18 acetylase RimI-like enzyme